MIPVRACYSLMQLTSPEEGLDVLVEHDVDPASGDVTALLEGLQVWAVRELIAQHCPFGLYVAEFATYDADGAQQAFLRELSLIWDGTELLAVHINHGPSPARSLGAVISG
ncbi:hypothetical protein ABZ805_26510 [Saccharopolyspora sp. NPDC047091]|uniref:hypothetical protein n=1 Tax=Saccharopolyspora sp. NPDC047091 TaxID=3155924 RepID=UPI0033EF0EC9